MKRVSFFSGAVAIGLVAVSMSFFGLPASGQRSECQDIKPSQLTDIDQTIKAELDGVVQRMILGLGATASFDVEYRKVSNSTLDKYPEAFKFYFLQQAIYQYCLKSDVPIPIEDLVALFKALNIEESDSPDDSSVTSTTTQSLAGCNSPNVSAGGNVTINSTNVCNK